VLFLLIPVVIGAIGVTIVVMHQRRTPSLTAGIDDFRRARDAIAGGYPDGPRIADGARPRADQQPRPGAQRPG